MKKPNIAPEQSLRIVNAVLANRIGELEQELLVANEKLRSKDELLHAIVDKNSNHPAFTNSSRRSVQEIYEEIARQALEVTESNVAVVETNDADQEDIELLQKICSEGSVAYSRVGSRPGWGNGEMHH